MKPCKILIVDDEPQARGLLRTALVEQGFEVNAASTGEEALEKLREDTPDVILLDPKMPGMGGFETCREIRTSSEVPVIIVTAREGELARAEAFDASADQYVVKPCSVRELIARIRAVRRRAMSVHAKVLRLDEVEINFETHEVSNGDKIVHLTAKEFKLLHFLASRPGEGMSQRRILQAVWGPDYGDELEYLRVFINQLRKKIEPDPRNPRYIVTDLPPAIILPFRRAPPTGAPHKSHRRGRR